MNVTESRATQVRDTVNDFIAGFNQSYDTPAAKEEFLKTYSPDVKWADHAFLVRREGHEAIFGLQKSFTYCNQPFNAKLKRLEVTSLGAVVEMIWQGRHTNDIVRWPSGVVAVKATGKDFVTHVCMILEIDANGRITRIDEFYNKHWEDGKPEEQYVVMTGPDKKPENE